MQHFEIQQVEFPVYYNWLLKEVCPQCQGEISVGDKLAFGLCYKCVDKAYNTCVECGIYPADYPSQLCTGCEAYQEHQQ